MVRFEWEGFLGGTCILCGYSTENGWLSVEFSKKVCYDCCKFISKMVVEKEAIEELKRLKKDG
jgi:hypothetical protein